jgi:hypothetical protein
LTPLSARRETTFHRNSGLSDLRIDMTDLG